MNVFASLRKSHDNLYIVLKSELVYRYYLEHEYDFVKIKKNKVV